MKKIAISVIVILLVAAVYWGTQYYRSEQQKKQEVIYIALAGPLSASRGPAMRNGVNLYLEQIGYEVNGAHIEVIEYDDDDSNIETAKIRAEEIGTDPRNPLVVIGNRTSNAALNAGPIYKKYKIPAITASAPAPSVTKENEWYFRVIIENTRQGHFISHYVSKILRYDTISVVYVDTEYGKSLGEAVINQAEQLGLNIAYQKVYPNTPDNEAKTALLNSIVNEVRQISYPGIVILAVGDGDGALLVKGFRDKSENPPILEALITDTFDNDILEYSKGNLPRYLKNVWTTQHLLYDTGNKLAQEFRDAYHENYDGKDPDAAAAAYYDATMIAIEAIKATKVDGKDPQGDRQKIRDYMSTLTRINPDLQGTTGYIYFDEDRNAIKPIPIGFYDEGNLISTPIQLQAIPNTNLIGNLQKEQQNGNIILIDDIYFYKTQVVYTGVDINEITNLDMKNSTFTADFYLWFRHQGKLDLSKIEFVNAVDTVTLENPIAESVGSDGTVYRAYRVKANFKSDFNFKAYPFDQQTVNITLRDISQTREQLTFVQDSLRLLPKNQQIEQLEKAGIEGWNTTGVVVYSDIIRSSSTLGNPNLNTTGFEYSAFKVDTTIKRDALNFSIKNLFPIVAVLILAYLAFFIPVSEFGMRVSLGINAIMTTAFFSLKVSSDLPSIGYITALEYIFFMTYTLAVFVIVLAIVIFFADKKSNDKLTTRLTWAGRIIFPLIMVIVGYMITRII